MLSSGVQTRHRNKQKTACLLARISGGLNSWSGARGANNCASMAELLDVIAAKKEASFNTSPRKERMECMACAESEVSIYIYIYIYIFFIYLFTGVRT